MPCSYLLHQASFMMQIRANHSPIMHCSGNKSVVIVRKRAERPLPSWAGEMRWDEGLRSFKSKMPETACLCHLGPRWGGVSHNAASLLPLCALPLLTSLSLHHFVLFRDQLAHPFVLTQESKQYSVRVAGHWKTYDKCSFISKNMENYIHFC